MDKNEALETIEAMKLRARELRGTQQVSWRECSECLINCLFRTNGSFEFRVIRKTSSAGTIITEGRALRILQQYEGWVG